MRRVISSFALLSLGFAISSCDMLDMPQTTKNMDSTTTHMDKTTETMASTTSGMANTTNHLSNQTDHLANQTDHLAGTTDQMAKTTGEMSGEIKKTNEGVHKQTLLLALKDMYDPDNTKTLSPVPFGMFKGGKTFAEEVREDEAVDWFYAEYKNIVEGTADDSKRVAVKVLVPQFDNGGNVVFQAQYDIQQRGKFKYEVPKLEWDFPIDYLAEFNNQKDIHLNAMQVVAGFLPQDMVTNIVSVEIAKGGLRKQMALMMLNLRDTFKRGALLTNSLYEDKLSDLAQFKEAYRHVQDLDYIANLPYTDQIHTSLKGYLDLSEGYIYEMQADQNDLAAINIAPVPAPTAPAFVPVTAHFDSTRSINSPNQAYYATADDQLHVQPVDQGGARTAGLAYDKTQVMKDWKTLDRRYSDMPKSDQDSPEAQALRLEVKKHIQ